jgi:murein DD-endopeptidase MepM/ murein hydrolase activator NlpD
MSEHFHIIIAGDQRRPVSIRISKVNVIATAITLFIIASALFSTGFYTTGLYAQNKLMAKSTASAKAKMRDALAVKTNLEEQLEQKIQDNMKMVEALKYQYNQRIARIDEQHFFAIERHKDRIASIIHDNTQQISQLENEHAAQVAMLEQENLEQSLAFKEEKELLISTAVSQLNARSKFIEDVITDIGIDIRPPVIKQSSKNKGGPFVATENKGGPFIAAEDSNYDELLYRADNYIEKMQTLPLGRPIKGSVSSWFGKRKDPLNQKAAFHEGIDFRGRTGDPVVATADGKVIYAGKNGGYGNFIKISHGDGFTTGFAHLHKINVRSGDHITRGQVIGSVGNSGRSTGSHLHYEVNLKGRPIDPAKFMKVANLTCTFNTPSETK